MKRVLLVIAVLLATAVAACTKTGGSTTSTTPTTPTAPTPTPTPAPLPAPTPTPLPAPVQTTFTLSGTITGNDTKGPLVGAELEALDGPNVGSKATSDSNGAYAVTNLSAGTYKFRVRMAGYQNRDVTATISNADVKMDIDLNKTPPPPPPPTVLTADFFQAPNPCTMIGDPVVVNCGVDGTPSAGPSPITLYSFSYLGRTVAGNVQGLILGCGDGPEKEVHIPVTLTVTDTDGNTATTSKSVTVVKSGGACGF